MRVDFRKTRGVFNKSARRTGNYGSGPSDLDLTIQTYPDLDLILSVGFGSNGSRRLSRGGGRRPLPVAARLGNSPDFTEIGAPGVKMARVWVWDDLHDTHDPPEALARHGGTLGCVRKGDGGSAWRRSPACAHSRCAGLTQGCRNVPKASV